MVLQDHDGDTARPYPSRLVADNGARSLNSNLEWFGPNTDSGLTESNCWVKGVSPEPDASNEANGPDATVDPDGTLNVLHSADLDRFDKAANNQDRGSPNRVYNVEK